MRSVSLPIWKDDADEAFVTGTFGGLTPVVEVDGRPIGDGTAPGPMTVRLRDLYREAVEADVAARRAERAAGGSSR